MLADDYGIPVMFFGDVSDDFYGMVGRVAMLATLVEDRLLSLVWTCDRENTQDKYAGEMGGNLINLCRRFLPDMPSIETLGSALLDRTQEALLARHEIVHSLWPNPGPEKAFRHRPLPARKRVPPNEWLSMAEIEVADIRELILTLVGLVEELDQFRSRVQSARAGF